MNPQDNGDSARYQFVLSAAGNPGRRQSNLCNLGSVCGDASHNDGRISPPSKRPNMMPNWYGRMMPAMERKPECEADLNEVEGLIASSMTKLSLQDREQAMDDVHGIRGRIGEQGAPEKVDGVTASTVLSAHNAISKDSTSFLTAKDGTTDGKIDADTAASLREMEALLQRSQNNAYLLAMRQNPEYVQNVNFRLSFLNSLFDPKPKEAVDKILKFLEQKLELFGKEALCRDLTLADLGRSGRKCLQSGLYQYLGRDSAGRRVIGSFPFSLDFDTPDDVVSWFHCKTCTDDCILPLTYLFSTDQDGVLLVDYSATTPRFCQPGHGSGPVHYRHARSRFIKISH